MKKFIAFVICIIPFFSFAQTSDSPLREPPYYQYDSVAVKPQFPGGEQALTTFITDHLEYPEDAIQANVQGDVKVWFIVEATGDISNIRAITQDLKKGCENEAERIVAKMPSWTPGKYNGKDVAVEMTLTVPFKIN